MAETRATNPVRDVARPAAGPGGELSRSRPLGLLLLTVVLAGSAMAGVAPLREADTLAPVPDVTLELPLGYVVLGPLSALLDALTLLALSQHYALWVILLGSFATWRIARSRRRRSPGQRLAVELGAAALAAAVLFGVYAVMLLVPRPMAKLAVDDPDTVVLDFHSHTEASWDGRVRFDASRRRAWHREAGFHAAFVSDHRTFSAVSDAQYTNPVRAGEGTVLLSAVELRFAGTHINALGEEERYAPFSRDGRLEESEIDSALAAGGRDPMLLLTIPAALDRLRPGLPGVRAGVWAVELTDGAPKGIEQSRRDRTRILHLADSLGLAVVSGSNHHGWGRAPGAWSLMKIPGWRGLHPDSLAALIEQKIRTERRSAVRVVERALPAPGPTQAALLLSVPAVVWRTIAGLSLSERIAWLAWLWGTHFLWRWLRRRGAAAAAQPPGGRE
ncbi:MAG TPA: hypothetical protein VMM18_03695 [Gemmatimonadaceae bacterium]|nr:hypothetical protein [Gemmatimonadaceae bacterium]